MTSSIKGSQETGPNGWVLVQEGLFEYPLGDGTTPALLGQHCTKCRRYFFPRRSLCPYCLEEGAMEDARLGGRGVIYACTVVHRDSPAGIKAPYAYGYVQIPENRLRVFALLTGREPGSFAPGQEVELVIEPIMTDKEGRKVIGYKFRAV